MPKYQADSHAKTVERLLHARDFAHLRARKYGATVIVESGPDDDVYKHLRLTRDGVHVWSLHIANHRGRWEPTPFRAVRRARHPRRRHLPLDPPIRSRLPGTDFGSRALGWKALQQATIATELRAILGGSSPLRRERPRSAGS